MGLMGFLCACGGPSLKEHKGAQPQMKLEEYFKGPIKAWGMVQDRSGNVVRRFDIDLVGSWENGEGKLVEDFSYYDGEKQNRVWTIKKVADQRYEGFADDIIGKAEGEVVGNAVRWAYEMELPVDGRTFKVTFDDWMFLMNDGVLINRSYIKKFGITMAELTLFMQKQDVSQQAQEE